MKLKTRYRIVQRGHCEYTSERRWWWWPFWGVVCIHWTVDGAEDTINQEIRRAKEYPKVIKEL